MARLCKRGHELVVDRAGRTRCRECARIRAAEQRAKNPEEHRARKRAWRARNAERENARTRAWREANHAELLAARREQYANDPDRFRERNQRYYAMNADAMRAKSAQWRADNPEYRRAYYETNSLEISMRSTLYFLDRQAAKLEAQRAELWADVG